MRHKHLFAAGIIHASLACLGILAEAGFMLVFFLTPRIRESMDIGLVISQFVVAFLVIGAYGFWGVGLSRHSSWATGKLGYILTLISFTGFPLGTAAAIYTFCALVDFKKQEGPNN